MVKNTTGGTGTKSLARKHQSGGGRTELALPTCPLEQIACVTKALGNGMLEIHTNDDVRLILVGLREWETPIKNCDILTIYDSNQVEQLKNIPSIKIDHVIKLSLGNTYVQGSKGTGDDITFTEEDESNFGDLNKGKVKEDFKMETTTEIDFDDI